jgi:hypothetical protein
MPSTPVPSSSSTLQSTLSTQKRAAPSGLTKGDVKRQKGQDKQRKIREDALAALYQRWYRKFEATAILREEMSNTLDTGTLEESELLVKLLDTVRTAARRPTLTPAQTAVLPTTVPLLRMLLDIFMRPYTWSATKHSDMLHLEEDSMLVDSDMTQEGDGSNTDDQAQFYVRRLSFESFEEMEKLLEKVKIDKPHYGAHIEGLIKEGQKASTSSSDQLHLSYGGFTVANTPVGRQLDDAEESEAADWGILKAILNAYEGAVKIYEVLTLRFQVKESQSLQAGQTSAPTCSKAW